MLLVALLAAPRAAQAAEDELVLAFSGGYGVLTTDAEAFHGAGGGFTLSFGLTDAIWLTGSGGAMRHSDRTLVDMFAGVTVALDVFRTIPFVELLLGAVFADLPDRTKLDPTVRLGLGADYLLSPEISLGAVAHYRPVSDALGDSVFDVQLRFTWRTEL